VIFGAAETSIEGPQDFGSEFVMNYRLRTQFKITAISAHEACRYVWDLQRELTDRSWILRPQVQWDDAQQAVLVTFESPVENDAPAEPPILIQARQLKDCMRGCARSAPPFDLEDFLIVDG